MDISTEIGVLYLRINDNKKAFDKLFEVTKLYESCSKALLALGSILQVSAYVHVNPFSATYRVTPIAVTLELAAANVSIQSLPFAHAALVEK